MCVLPLHSNATESVYCFVCHLFSKLIYWHKLNQTVFTLSLCFYMDGSRSRQFQLWTSSPAACRCVSSRFNCFFVQQNTGATHKTITSELLSDAPLMTCIERRTKTAAHVLFLRQMSWRRDWNHHANMLTVIFTGWYLAKTNKRNPKQMEKRGFKSVEAQRCRGSSALLMTGKSLFML